MSLHNRILDACQILFVFVWIWSLSECAVHCGKTIGCVLLALMDDNCYLCFTDANQGVDLIDLNATTDIFIWYDTLMTGT